MKILVTGATGFIGRELVKKLQYSYDVVTLVRESSDILMLKELNCKIIKYKQNLEIIDIFQKEKIDAVIHCASFVIVKHNKNKIEELLNSNIMYGTYLLEASKISGAKWFINTGTFWQNYNNDDYNPVNLYAATKEAFENIAKYYTETSDLVFTTIKLNDTFGPNDTRDKIFNLWNNICKTNKSLDMSKGDQIIDISYIEDIINAYNLLINHLNSDKYLEFNHKTFAVKSNERMTLKELSKVFEDVIGKKLNINWGKRTYRNREVMNPIDSIALVPNWKQQYTLKEAIKKTIGV
jgi:nucleoside-diphosphate-sugar epimerase